MIKEKVLVIRIGKNALEEDIDRLKNGKIINAHKNVVYFDTWGQMFSILSDKKMELLDYLSQLTGKNVSQIAISLQRKEEAVSRDLHQLERIGLVELERKGNKVYPKKKYEEILIPTRSGRRG